MKLNRSAVRGLLALAIVLAVYLVLAFAIPFARTPVFWLSFVFSLLAILAQAFAFGSAFGRDGNVRSKFYGFPIARVGVIYLAAQLLAGFVFMALAAVAPAWLCLVVSVLILAAAGLGLISVSETRDYVEKQDADLKASVRTVRALQSKADFLASQAAGAEKAALQQLAEHLRYSDPVTNASTEDSEATLLAGLDELQNALLDKDSAAVCDLCVRLEATLAERNRLCKLNK